MVSLNVASDMKVYGGTGILVQKESPMMTKPILPRLKSVANISTL